VINNDTIVALATPQGMGAIGVIRLSGQDAITIADSVFKGKALATQKSHSIHYGHIIDDTGKAIDEVMVALFKAPKSFTTEDVVEISCHGSSYIQEQIIRLLIQQGARAAKPGEFTLRAFLNGRIDLSQAEAVADLIASDSATAHDVAMKQMRGGFANQIKDLRSRLVHFASLIELELDFAEEDVEFANRGQLIALIDEIQTALQPLIASFKLGNVIKNGVNTVIAGKPNAGKSTLLNALLNEQRAIVSEIPGTTRDTIEETLNINGLLFRFIDTAGLRSTSDIIEAIGVERTMEKLRQSSVYIYLFDVNSNTPQEVHAHILELGLADMPGIVVANKIDQSNWKKTSAFQIVFPDIVYIAASQNHNIERLKEALYKKVMSGNINTENTIITNLRHYDALVKANEALEEVKTGINLQNTGELTALDIKRALEYLGQISGEVTNDEILGNIFSKFCIGK
jgi:tRNA modification GTPase